MQFVSDKTEKLVKLLGEKGISYAAAQKALRKRDVKVNGRRTGRDETVYKGDEVLVYAQPSYSTHAVLYEDENVLAVDKKKGVESEALFAELSAARELYFIHRLDRNTDGVLLFAKTRAAEAELLAAFKNRAFEKIYRAEVYGKFAEKEGILCDYLVKDAANARVKIHKTPVKGSVRVVTAYEVTEERENSSVLAVRLVTGRTHQIRAHLAFYGHFVIGDGKYGKESVNRAFGAKRQRLSAEKLVLHFHGGALAYLDGKTIERGN